MVGVGMAVPSSTRNERQVVYTNHYPSLLYIDSADGSTQLNTRTSSSDTSDIIQIIIHPYSPNPPPPRKAVAVLEGSVEGTLVLTQDTPPTGATRVEGTITGLTPGLHGFHVHQFGDLSGGCGTAGGHYNPFRRNHGHPDNLQRHVGDLGNILADNNGTAYVNITDELVTLVGPRAVVGRAVVVHAGEDDVGLGGDAESLKTGNAGGRVGCGVIGYA
ncbi:Superoxide dismutase [Cu-Zn]-like 3 [Homarus americanus]|uniref:Superoxide dismutase [Cu-Zn] n=2 Tax=Homarus americanus TaxID=6706 RepID=A0A8J5KK91_HOMAM|nr:Superoxide dismutase [Cu-Zn]-like 3 [Homarus americanus]